MPEHDPICAKGTFYDDLLLKIAAVLQNKGCDWQFLFIIQKTNVTDKAFKMYYVTSSLSQIVFIYFNVGIH